MSGRTEEQWKVDIWLARQIREYVKNSKSSSNWDEIREQVDWNHLAADWDESDNESVDWGKLICEYAYVSLDEEQCDGVVPPLNEVYSYRKRPCRLEQRSQLFVQESLEDDPEQSRCPFKRNCVQSAAFLTKVFGRGVKVTLSEPSSSIVVRSEHQYHRNERQRLALRKHLHESRLVGPRALTENLWCPVELSDDAIEEIVALLRRGQEGISEKQIGELTRFLRVERSNCLTPRSLMGRLTEWLDQNTLLRVASSRVKAVVQSRAIAPLSCHPFSRDEELGEYLGFIDLRLFFEASPLAMGLLSVPAYMRHDLDTYVITGSYGRFFGGEAFPCTVYSMHDPATSAAHCAQACVIMAISMLADRKAQIRGTYSLTYLASPGEGEVGAPNCRCVKKIKEEWRPQSGFHSDGLHSQQIRKLISNSNASAAVVKERFNSGTTRLLSAILKAYIVQRFPVILLVATRKWWSWERKTVAPCHAITIVGIRRKDGQVSLVVHDPGYIPYYEKSLELCLEAARSKHYIEDKESLADNVFLVTTGDVLIKRHAIDVVDAIKKSEDCQEFLNCVAGVHDYDMDVHLLHRDAVMDSLYVPGLFKREDIHDPASNKWKKLYLSGKHEIESSLPSNRFWAIVAKLGKNPRCVWLFDSTRKTRNDSQRPWDARLRSTAGVLDIEIQERQHFPVARNRRTRVSKIPVAPEARELTAGVITSSSIRELRDLFAEVQSISDVNSFDLMILRDTDIAALGRFAKQRLNLSGGLPPVSDILANEDHFELIADWLRQQCKPNPTNRVSPSGIPSHQVNISAFATYFPDITALHDVRRENAICALVQTILHAIHLKRDGFMANAIVEIVCGNVVDPCECSPNTVFKSTQTTKIDILMDSLVATVDRVRDHTESPFALALELEPGVTYVLNKKSYQGVCYRIGQDSRLRGCVGLNVDVAHMKLAEISAHDLLPFQHQIVHAHISDHPPRMHTRDQVVGEWTTVDRHQSDYLPYLRLLADRTAKPNDCGLPFSGVVALELEGCNRISWVHRSLSALRHAIQIVKNHS